MSATIDLWTSVGETLTTPSPAPQQQHDLYGFTPNLAANLVYCILFAVLWVVHSVGMYYRQWWFSTAFWFGCGLEFAGYLGRLLSSHDVTNLNDFLIQIICLTLAPAFFSGGVYYLLAKLVTVYGRQYSPIKPILYTYIFISCDVVSLAIQAAGGGMAAIALQTNKDANLGTHIMLAGICFQVVSMTTFLALFFMLLWRIYKAQAGSIKGDSSSSPFEPQFATLRSTKFFRVFPATITVCMLFIYVRCVYRVAELSEGWFGFLITHEVYFLILDGLMVFLGVLSLTVVHPGMALGRGHIPAGGVGQEGEQDVEGEVEPVLVADKML